MKTTARSLRSSALAASFVLVFLTVKSYGTQVLIGLNYGYSSALTQVRYDQYSLDYYTSPKLKACLSSSIGIAFNTHFSLIAEWFRQEFDEVNHYMSDAGDVVSGSSSTEFDYFGLSLEYRFFKDIRRSWNPYFNVGAYGLFYLDLFGGGAPEYPKTVCFKAAAGARIRVAGPLYFNPLVAYYSGSSSVSFQAGLGLIL